MDLLKFRGSRIDNSMRIGGIRHHGTNSLENGISLYTPSFSATSTQARYPTTSSPNRLQHWSHSSFPQFFTSWLWPSLRKRSGCIYLRFRWPRFLSSRLGDYLSSSRTRSSGCCFLVWVDDRFPLTVCSVLCLLSLRRYVCRADVRYPSRLITRTLMYEPVL